MKRGTEAWLDALAEADEETDGEILGVDVVTLTVPDERIVEIAAYCAIAAPREIVHGHATWLEASGRFRKIVVTLKTAERRRKAAA